MDRRQTNRDLGEVVPSASMVDLIQQSPPCGETLGESGRHPIETAPFVDLEEENGLRGRKRDRVQVSEHGRVLDKLSAARDKGPFLGSLERPACEDCQWHGNESSEDRLQKEGR